MTLSKEDKQEIAEMIAAAVKGAPVKHEDKEPRPMGPDFEAWEENAIKSESTGLKIAPEDYYEVQEDGTKKTHFTFEEAMEIEKKTGGKWRLPSMVEWTKIVCEFAEKDGDFDSEKLREFLGPCNQGSNNSYWSRIVNDDEYAYSLYFDSYNVSPQSCTYMNLKLLVRLIRQ